MPSLQFNTPMHTVNRVT